MEHPASMTFIFLTLGHFENWQKYELNRTDIRASRERQVLL
jgi:hypothetical protein